MTKRGARPFGSLPRPREKEARVLKARFRKLRKAPSSVSAPTDTSAARAWESLQKLRSLNETVKILAVLADKFQDDRFVAPIQAMEELGLMGHDLEKKLDPYGDVDWKRVLLADLSEIKRHEEGCRSQVQANERAALSIAHRAETYVGALGQVKRARADMKKARRAGDPVPTTKSVLSPVAKEYMEYFSATYFPRWLMLMMAVHAKAEKLRDAHDEAQAAPVEIPIVDLTKPDDRQD